jgi:hypothetical protein
LNAVPRTLSADPGQRPAPPSPAPAPAPRAAPSRAVPRPASAHPSEGADAHGAAAARILAAARPWWFAFPGVMIACANVVLMPLVVQVAEAAVALALLAALGLVLAWHLGYVADRDVVAALKPVGQRILAMVQSAGGG